MNKFFGIGRLTQSPTMQTLNSGHRFCRFSIAINRQFQRDGENTADFINIVAWDGLADNCNKFLAKGSQVAVTGSVQTGSYTDKNGIKRQTFDIRADQVEFLSKANSQPTQPKQASIDDLKELESETEMPF